MTTLFSEKKQAQSVYPKTAEPVEHSRKYRWLIWLSPIMGLAALIWFLIRVIPKPSRATYPCQRVAFPLASGFVIWIMGLAGSIAAFHKAKRSFRRARYIVGITCICVSIGFIWSSLSHTTAKIVLGAPQTPNEPIGTAQGIFPGRVVWVYDSNATNENCTNTYTPIEDGWFLSKNNDQAVIDRMVSQMLRSLTGEISDEAAWDALFRDFNQKKGRGSIGYFPGEKIMLKINAVSTWEGNYNSDYSIVYNDFYGISETSPQIILSVLRQLVNVYGVQQQDITVGDPMKHIYRHTYDLLHNEFLSVKYLDHSSHYWRRTQMVPSTEPQIFYSDRGTVLHEEGNSTPVFSDYLPTCITEANYYDKHRGFQRARKGGDNRLREELFRSKLPRRSRASARGPCQPGRSQPKPDGLRPIPSAG